MIGAFGENFPYTNFHNLNLDWVIKVIREVNEKYPALIEDLMRTKVNAPTGDTIGELDDFLVSNGDGTTSWKPFDVAISGQIQEAVNAWLTAHPEATTTVQDHSLSYEKMIIGTLGYVTPEMFGAYGDGVHNDLQAIQDALDAGPVVVFQNEYYINSSSTAESINYLTVPSDRTLLFHKGSYIKIAGTNHFIGYSIFFLDEDTENVTFDGAHIIGDMSEYGYNDSTEWCHGIAMQKSYNVRIMNCEIEECRGDGIATQNAISQNIWIDKCFIHDNGRNNISVVSADYIKITNCRLDNARRTAPMYGIDIEPNSGAGQNVKNCVIDNCTFSGNRYGAITISATEVDQKIYISNCTCEGAIAVGVRNSGCSVIVSNCTIIPLAKVSASEEPTKWAYNVGVALAVQGSRDDANIIVSDIVVDCRNGISYPVKILGNMIKNISIRNMKIMNGTFDSYSWHPSDGVIKNVDMEFVVDASASISGTVVVMAGKHTEAETELLIKLKNAQTLDAGGYILGNEIVIDGASATNISLTYPFNGADFNIKTVDASGHNLMGVTFKNAVTGAESALLGMETNKWFHLWWDVYAEKMWYLPLDWVLT